MLILAGLVSEHASVGFFWMNAAEGWIDVLNDKLNTKVSPTSMSLLVLSSLAEFVESSTGNIASVM